MALQSRVVHVETLRFRVVLARQLQALQLQVPQVRVLLPQALQYLRQLRLKSHQGPRNRLHRQSNPSSLRMPSI